MRLSSQMKRTEDALSATAIEYGLIAAGVAVAIIAVMQGLGSKIFSMFQ